MTKRQARRLVLDVAARTILHDIDNGSGWIYGDDDGPDEDMRSEADVKRIHEAIRELAAEFRRRAGEEIPA